ncbi:MAG: tetratricopeptide repeat protein [Chitinispirillaceae bacterium]|nr:tetratricopeptide repeat protein [Chitinispirillaceae bacterium]
MASESIESLFAAARDCRRSDPAAALAHLRDIARRAPLIPETYNNIGLILFEAGKFSEALTNYNEALRLDPDRAEFHCNCAAVLESMGAAADAESHYRKAIELKKDCVEAYLGLGLLNHFTLKNLAEAKQRYSEALRLKPDNGRAHYFLGAIMRSWERLDLAVTCFRNAARFLPNHILSIMNLGEALQASGCIEESIECFRKAVALAPDNALARSNLLLSMNYDPGTTPLELFEEHRKWGLQFAFPQIVIDRKPGRKLKIGYLSADFCLHPASSFLEPVIANHDPTRFAVYCYSHGNEHDEITEKFTKLSDAFRHIQAMSDEDAEKLIRSDEIDILVDCTGHMAYNRLPLFARAIAPVRISWIGYPCTTGLPGCYRFTDDITDPPGSETLFTEKLIRLENGFCCYAPPRNAPLPSPLPARTNNFVTFGSLNTTARLNSAVIALWSDVLSTVKNSRLLIFRTTLNDEITGRLIAQFATHGIDKKRIDFKNTVPAAGHLAVYHAIDIALDTIPWSGHTTACEALWMGVPVITLRGNRHAGRMVASVLSRIGLTSYIAESKDGYADRARQLSGNLTALADLRSSLRETMRRSALCDAKSACRSVESKYRALING